MLFCQAIENRRVKLELHLEFTPTKPSVHKNFYSRKNIQLKPSCPHFQSSQTPHFTKPNRQFHFRQYLPPVPLAGPTWPTIVQACHIAPTTRTTRPAKSVPRFPTQNVSFSQLGQPPSTTPHLRTHNRTHPPHQQPALIHTQTNSHFHSPPFHILQTPHHLSPFSYKHTPTHNQQPKLFHTYITGNKPDETLQILNSSKLQKKITPPKISNIQHPNYPNNFTPDTIFFHPQYCTDLTDMN